MSSSPNHDTSRLNADKKFIPTESSLENPAKLANEDESQCSSKGKNQDMTDSSSGSPTSFSNCVGESNSLTTSSSPSTLSSLVQRRRGVCPQSVQILWDVISHIKKLKQPSSLEKIQAHVYKKHHIRSSDCERQLHLIVKDGLITRNDDIFSLPHEDNKPVDDSGHDWYCYECHRPGDVLLCSTCWRVYHTFCIKDDVLLHMENGKGFVCTVCKMLKEDMDNPETGRQISEKELNMLLSYTFNRLIEKGKDSLQSIPNTKEDEWKAKYLLYNKIDLSDIQKKTRQNKYKRLRELEVDCKNLVHCVVTFYGSRTAVSELATQIFEDCIYDLNEIKQCVDCYRMSNEKQEKYWFCQPCNPRHELVFAKQKGFAYWPAKVIKVDNHVYDVRFFGSFHERALIEEEFIKPIDTDIRSLRLMKRTAQLNRAFDELKRHQKLLEVEASGTAKTRKKTPATAAKKVPLKKGLKKTMSPVTSPAKKSPPKNRRGKQTANAAAIKVEDEQEDDEDDGHMDEQRTLNGSADAKEGNLDESLEHEEEEKLVKRGRRRRNSTPDNVVTSSSEHPFTPCKVSSGTQTNKELLAPFYENKDEISPTTAAALIDAGCVLPADKIPSSEESNSVDIPNSIELPNSVGTSTANTVADELDEPLSKKIRAETEESEGRRTPADSITSQESEESVGRKRPTRTPKPNSKFFASDIEPLILTGKRPKKPKPLSPEPNKSKSSDTEQTPEPKVTETKMSRRGRPPREVTNDEEVRKPLPKGRPKGSLSKKTLAKTPILNSLLSKYSALRPTAKTKTGRPKGRPRKYGGLGYSSSASVALAKIAHPPSLKPGAICDCESKYQIVMFNLEESLKSKHKSQLLKVRKEVDDKEREKEKLLTKISSMQKQIDTLRTNQMIDELETRYTLEIETMKEQHKQELSSMKKKQWCFNCEKEAIYFCCWNTSYCSLECQQQHWHAEHKKSCRRGKR